jgi:hypothetical protein
MQQKHRLQIAAGRWLLPSEKASLFAQWLGSFELIIRWCVGGWSLLELVDLIESTSSRDPLFRRLFAAYLLS